MVALEVGGFKLNTMDLGDYGIHAYGQVLFVNEALAKSDPDTVRRMTRATLKAWQYTMANIPEAIAILQDYVPETEPAMEIPKWPEISKRTKAYGGVDVPFGHQDAAGWASTYATFKEAGLIDQDYAPADLIAKV
jgi:ABC-type nitrate/sulfonate/bicarbonate transport system substrate-binding protein